MIYTTANTSMAGKPVKVYVNGNEVKMPVYADTDKGIVRCIARPVRVKKGSDALYQQTRRGKVTVEQCDIM